MSTDNEILVKVDGVSKKFCRDLKKSLWYGVKDVASELLTFGKQKTGIRNQGSANFSPTPDSRLLTADPALRPGEFWANKDISFELKRGECIGLIGRNGAGKTTLLKMLNGLIKPDSGTIEMRGRVGALIALGAGFNPILTGRENIYVNGSILGLSKEEIDAKIDDIIDFAEIRDFIDTPVQSYSSGMQVRLGFAVATALDPDVLILDEVLAVGDASFRNKCYKRIVSLRKKAAVLFVTHNMEQVGRICDHVLMLKRGHVSYHGDVANGIRNYELDNEDESEGDDSFLSISEPIEEFQILNIADSVASGKSLPLEISVKSSQKIDRYTIRIIFYNASGGFAADGNLDMSGPEAEILPASNRFCLQVNSLPLKSGRYQFAMNLIDPSGDLIVWSYKQYVVTVTDSHQGAISDCQLSIAANKVTR